MTVLLFAGTATHAQPVPLGDEILVNGYTTGPQRNPSVCIDDEGGFVATWEDGRANELGLDVGLDGSEIAVAARRFGADATPLADQFLVNTYTTGSQFEADVACLPNGGFVVAWKEREEEDYFFYGDDSRAVLARPFIGDAGGDAPAPLPDIELESIGEGFAGPTSTNACSGPGGGFVVVWEGAEPGGGIRVQLFDAAGQASGPSFDAPSSGPSADPSCCGRDDGFVVAWVTSVGLESDIAAQRYAADGMTAGTTFLVNTYTPGDQRAPEVACNERGDFVVVWEREDEGSLDDDREGVFGQRFDRNGAAVGTEFRANTVVLDSQLRPDAAMDRAGRFVVVWESVDQPMAGDRNVFGQAFTSGAGRLGSEFQVNGYTSEDSNVPAIAMDPDGKFVVVWHNKNDGDDHSIHGRLFTLGPAPSTTTTMLATTTTVTVSTTLPGGATTTTTVTVTSTLPGGTTTTVVGPTTTMTTTTTTTTTTMPAASCGDPIVEASLGAMRGIRDAVVTASDALFLLRAAVGSVPCESCICDVDGSGAVTASDALLALKFAVGQPVALACPPC